MLRNRKLITVILMAVAALLVMAYIEKILQPGYWIKSLIKMLMLGGSILLYSFMYKKDIKELIGLKNKRLSKQLILFMFLAYMGIIILYLLLKDQIDLTGIKESLLAKEHLSRDNFIFIFAYIILINSFLEESFFRGFIPQVFRDEGQEKTGIILSAVIFALYHISIMDGWFSPAVMVFGTSGLFVTGLFLQYICSREGTLYGSWLVHAFANLAINTVATIMLLT